MTHPTVNNHPSAQQRSAGRAWAAAALGVLLIGAVAWRVHAAALQRTRVRLLTVPADAVPADPALVAAALRQARPLFAQYCAACHGGNMRGNPAIGAPDLTDAVWLYGRGDVFDIERTLLYGIRSQLAKTRNISDMPALGVTGILRPDEIRQVVQYLLQLSRRPHDGQAALAGRELYFGRGSCPDCHGADARGNADYGAPDLTADVWNSGADPASLYSSIYFGRHRVMPGWIGTLTLEQIRALAVYVYAASHPPRPRGASADEHVAQLPAS